jgi:hypothetical protein
MHVFSSKTKIDTDVWKRGLAAVSIPSYIARSYIRYRGLSRNPCERYENENTREVL